MRGRVPRVHIQMSRGPQWADHRGSRPAASGIWHPGPAPSSAPQETPKGFDACAHPAHRFLWPQTCLHGRCVRRYAGLLSWDRATSCRHPRRYACMHAGGLARRASACMHAAHADAAHLEGVKCVAVGLVQRPGDVLVQLFHILPCRLRHVPHDAVHHLALAEPVLARRYVLWAHSPFAEVDVALLLVHSQDHNWFLPAHLWCTGTHQT